MSNSKRHVCGLRGADKKKHGATYQRKSLPDAMEFSFFEVINGFIEILCISYSKTCNLIVINFVITMGINW